MDLKIVDGVIKRIRPTPSKDRNSKTETNVNYINICGFKYLKNLFLANNNVGGDYYAR